MFKGVISFFLLVWIVFKRMSVTRIILNLTIVWVGIPHNFSCLLLLNEDKYSCDGELSQESPR